MQTTITTDTSGRLDRSDFDRAKLSVGLFISIGVVLRLRQFFFDRSLWLDECLLVLNLLHRSAHGLLKPLDHGQGAPLGFLLAQKALISTFGSSEYVLRFIPLLGGLASLFLMRRVAEKLLTPLGVAIAVGLFALSDRAIYYSSEAKQYSTDVAITLLLYAVCFRMFQNHLRPADIALPSIIGVVAIWFSHPAAFVLAGLGICALFWSIRTTAQKQRFVWILLICSLWAASFLLVDLISLRKLTHSAFLMGYWREGFPPTPLMQPASLHWAINSVLDLASDPLRIQFTGIVLFAVCTGAAALLFRDKLKFFLLATPVLFAFLAAVLHRYPFRSRLMLFALPMLLLLITAGAEELFRATRTTFVFSGICFIVLLFLQPSYDAAGQLVRPKTVEEMRPVTQYYKKHRLPGDVVYLYYTARFPFEYYADREKLESIPIVVGIESRSNPESYALDLERLRGTPRVWTIFSHTNYQPGIDEEPMFLDQLDRMGKRLDSFAAPGAAAFLYDLSTNKQSSQDQVSLNSR